jgi:glutamate-ammonia-ligase adenylyltransferase
VTIEELGWGLSDITTVILSGVLSLAHRFGDGIEFGIVAMGRYGGAELGFGSDADIMYVYRAAGATDEEAQQRAEHIVHEIKRFTEDLRVPLDLDLGLRPEGKNGAIVRSLESYRAYYARWSLTWEAQALLRARPVVGDQITPVRSAAVRRLRCGVPRRGRARFDQAFRSSDLRQGQTPAATISPDRSR